MGEPPEFVKADEVAMRCRVTPSTVRKWCREGVIAATRVGREWLIPRAALEKQLEVK